MLLTHSSFSAKPTTLSLFATSLNHLCCFGCKRSKSTNCILECGVVSRIGLSPFLEHRIRTRSGSFNCRIVNPVCEFSGQFSVHCTHDLRIKLRFGYNMTSDWNFITRPLLPVIAARRSLYFVNQMQASDSPVVPTASVVVFKRNFRRF